MMKNIGLLLLGIWLVALALFDLTHWHFSYQNVMLAALALTAGIVVLLSVIKARFSDIGLLLLSIWLILRGCMQLFHVTFPHSALIADVLAIASGIFLILRK